MKIERLVINEISKTENMNEKVFCIITIEINYRNEILKKIN